MTKLFYFPSAKLNAKVSELVIEGFDIKVKGTNYVQLSKRPLGRRRIKSLINETTNENIIIYS